MGSTHGKIKSSINHGTGSLVLYCRDKGFWLIIRGAIKNNLDNIDNSSTRIGRGLMSENDLKSSTF